MEKGPLKGGVARASLDEVRRYLHMAMQYDTTGGTVSIDDFGRALLYKATDETGAIIGGYALTVVNLVSARVVWVEAAAGERSSVDFFRSYLPVIVEQARAMGATQLACVTRRTSLKKRVTKAGFDECGSVLRMTL